MDCVSCHTTQGAIVWAEKNRSGIKPAGGWSPDIYTNFKFNLKNIYILSCEPLPNGEIFIIPFLIKELQHHYFSNM
jgi:hypothetical protein